MKRAATKQPKQNNKRAKKQDKEPKNRVEAVSFLLEKLHKKEKVEKKDLVLILEEDIPSEYVNYLLKEYEDDRKKDHIFCWFLYKTIDSFETKQQAEDKIHQLAKEYPKRKDAPMKYMEALSDSEEAIFFFREDEETKKFVVYEFQEVVGTGDMKEPEYSTKLEPSQFLLPKPMANRIVRDYYRYLIDYSRQGFLDECTENGDLAYFEEAIGPVRDWGLNDDDEE